MGDVRKSAGFPPGDEPQCWVAMPIRCITFDWGDTLATNYSMPYLATQRRAFSALAGACEVDPALVVPGWMTDLAVSWSSSVDRVRNPTNQEFDMLAMLNRWVAATGKDPVSLRPAIDACTDRLADIVIPFAESLPVLSALKQRGYRIGIVSHVPTPGDACRRWFARHKLAPYIDFYSLSCEIGWIKPHSAHYEHAIAHAGCAPGEILHVGDHPWRDVEGGRAHGLRTCLRETEGLYSADVLAASQPDHRILLLRDVLDLA